MQTISPPAVLTWDEYEAITDSLPDGNVLIETTAEEAERYLFRRVEITAEDLAEDLKISKRRVYQLVDLGVLKKSRRGRFNAFQSIRDYDEYVFSGYKRRKYKSTLKEDPELLLTDNDLDQITKDAAEGEPA